MAALQRVPSLVPGKGLQDRNTHSDQQSMRRFYFHLSVRARAAERATIADTCLALCLLLWLSLHHEPLKGTGSGAWSAAMGSCAPLTVVTPAC